MARGSSHAGADVLDRVRRAAVRRAGARAHGRAALRHRSPRVRRPARRPVDSRSARSSISTSRSPTRRRFRPGMSRRLRAGTSPSCCPATAATSCSAATTATCRTRVWRSSIGMASPGARRLAGAVWPLLPHGVRGQEFPATRRARRQRPLPGLDRVLSGRTRRTRSYSPRRAPFARLVECGEERRRAVRQVRRAPAPQPDDAVRFRNVSARRRADEGGPDEHGALDRIARAASRQPASLISRQRCPRTSRSANGRRKHILKEAVRSLLPPGIVDRKKQGFGVPLGVWFRGGLTEVFSDVLKSPRTRQRGYFEPAFVDRLVDEHLAGRARSHAAAVAAAGLRALAPPVSGRASRRADSRAASGVQSVSAELNAASCSHSGLSLSIQLHTWRDARRPADELRVQAGSGCFTQIRNPRVAPALLRLGL